MRIYKKAVKEILKKNWSVTVYDTAEDDDNMLSNNKYCKKYKEIISDIECCEIINAVIHNSNNEYLGTFSVINDFGLEDDEWINDYTISKNKNEWNELIESCYL